MKKNSSIHIKISTEQKSLLQKRASSCGLSLSSYVLFILLNAKPVIANNDTL